MRVIIGCEKSQIVCKAFRNLGYDAYSCDVQPCSGGHPEWHYQESIFDVLERERFDLGIFHPPCTHIAVSGAPHFEKKIAAGLQQQALAFVEKLMMWPGRSCIENPVSVISTAIRKPDQVIQPYYFGDNTPKKTCLWLKGLPKLKYNLNDNLFENKTSVEPEYYICNSAKTKSGKSKTGMFSKLGSDKGNERSVFFPGIAAAMALQWGAYVARQSEIEAQIKEVLNKK